MITRHRVLVVDDDAERTASAAQLVERFGHDVRVSGADDVHVLDAFGPALVIADVIRGSSLMSVLPAARRRPLCIAGFGERPAVAASPFDYIFGWPLRPHILRRLLWLVEVRRSSRAAR